MPCYVAATSCVKQQNKGAEHLSSLAAICAKKFITKVVKAGPDANLQSCVDALVKVPWSWTPPAELSVPEVPLGEMPLGFAALIKTVSDEYWRMAEARLEYMSCETFLRASNSRRGDWSPGASAVERCAGPCLFPWRARCLKRAHPY